MKNPETGRFILVDGVVYERKPDGSLIPAQNRTDYARIDAMSEAETENASMSNTDDMAMSDEEWLRGAIHPPVKIPVGLKLDRDVVEWFRSNGRGYQTRMNMVLRKYMESRRKAG